MGLKKAYFFVEDKYYAVLDRINRAIPIYKVVDPIDKVVPSFALLIGILALLVVLFLAWPLIAPYLVQPPAGYFATIKVMDDESNNPIAGAEVILTFPDLNEPVAKKTDSSGSAEFDIKSPEVTVSIEIKEESHQRYFKSEITLEAGQAKLFKLKGLAIVLKEKISIIVYDEVTDEKILDRPIRISFRCVGGTHPEGIDSVQNAQIAFEVTDPGNCSSLFGTVNANGYKEKTEVLEAGKIARFKLEKGGDDPQPTKGSLKVIVLDNSGSPEPNVEVKLLDSSTEMPEATKFSKDDGSALFESLNPGYYDAFCDAGDGRTKLEKNIRVIAGNTPAEKEVTLPALQVITKKLHFKAVDGQTSQPIENAHAVIRMDGTWFKVLDSNALGIARAAIGQSDASRTFTATISAEGYAYRFIELDVLNEAASPQVIELAPKAAGFNFKPVALFRATSYAGNAPLDINFDASLAFDPDGIIISYDWDFGDGNTANTVKPEHTYTVPGSYGVTLSVADDTGATASISMQFNIVETGQNIPPVPLFTADPYYGTAALEVDFNAEESLDYDGTIAGYAWDFNEGGTASGPLATYTFNSPGDYNVKLTVTDNDGAENSLIIAIQAAGEEDIGNLRPVAHIAVENNAFYGATPFKATFDGTASYDPDGSIVNYDWNFGDGALEGGESKTIMAHTFEQAGVFDVNLEVTDNDGAIASFVVQIQVVEGPENWKPVAVIDANAYHGTIPLTIDFNAHKSHDSDGVIVFYRWDFAGTTATGIEVTHTFATEGDHNVMLEVEDDDGAKSTDTITIQAYTTPPENLKPVAIFTASTYHGVAPLNVLFNGQESMDPDGTIASYAWNFGNGATATGDKVSYTYTTAGEYTVTLTVTDNKGATATRDRNIEVIAPGINLNPVAIINASTYFGQIPLSVGFSGENSFDPDGTISSYAWDFGDGNTDTGADVTHTYEGPGYFKVTLTVKDNSNNTGTASVFIEVVEFTVPNTGSILAKILNQNLDPLEGAEIILYHEDSTIIDYTPTPISGTDGTFLFESLPVIVHKYYVKAFYQPDLSGESEHKHLIPGDTIELEVVLAPRFGTIEAYVHEGETPIENAKVSFLKASDNSLLGDCMTSAEGKCTSANITAGTSVLVRAEKAGYLTDEPTEITVLADNVHQVSLELSAAMTGVEVEKPPVVCLDAACAEVATSIESDAEEIKYYFLKFRVLFGAPTSTDAMFTARAGPDSEEALPAEDYKVKITQVIDSTADAILLATCFDPTDPFGSLPACTGAGDSFKQAVVAWNELGDTSGVSKTVIVKIGIEPGLAAGTKAEIHFAAKATQVGLLAETGDLNYEFEIGAPVCSEVGLGWKRFITINATKQEIPPGQAPADYVGLAKDSEYDLSFTLVNCTGEALSNIEISALNENSEDSISFPALGAGNGPHVVTTIADLADGEVSAEHTFKIKAEAATDKTAVKLTAEPEGATPEGSTSEMLFKVLYGGTGCDLIVTGLPHNLSEGVPIVLSGTVKDSATGAVVQGAIVEIKLEGQLLHTATTDAQGNFSFSQSSGANPALGQKVYVIVNKAGCNQLTIEIPVVTQGQPPLIDCVKIDPAGPATVNKGGSGSFNLVSQNCPAAVDVTLLSLLKLPVGTLTLAQTESRSVSFQATGTEVFQGIYPIEVKGLLAGSASQRRIGVFEVIVNDTDPNACFEMDNYVFDMQAGTATASIRNKCFFNNRDPTNPDVGINTAAAELEMTNDKDKIPASISFEWEINSFAKQVGGADFDVQAISGNFTANPQQGLVFDIASFDPADYINGNDSEGITGLKESGDYADGLLLGVKFVPSSNTDEIEVWIEGDKVKGRYAGKEETTGAYPFSLTNKSISQSEYAFITIEDLVNGGGD